MALTTVESLPWTAFANDPQAERRRQALVRNLRAALAARLPDYMVPTSYTVIDALPLTTNGKLDRSRLPSPDNPVAASVPPRTEREEKILSIWQAVLRLETLGVTDNFFEAGGHSLLATQLVSRLRSTFALEISLMFVFENPTVEAQAVAMENLATEVSIPKTARSEAEDIAALLENMDALDDNEVDRLLARLDALENV